jgi:hypothetical protein
MLNASKTSRAHHQGLPDQWRNEMNTSLKEGSAKIYQFPAGGRAALGGRRYEENKTVTELAATRVSNVAVGEAWYHDAAIQDTREH